MKRFKEKKIEPGPDENLLTACIQTAIQSTIDDHEVAGIIGFSLEFATEIPTPSIV